MYIYRCSYHYYYSSFFNTYCFCSGHLPNCVKCECTNVARSARGCRGTMMGVILKEAVMVDERLHHFIADSNRHNSSVSKPTDSFEHGFVPHAIDV